MTDYHPTYSTQYQHPQNNNYAQYAQSPNHGGPGGNPGGGQGGGGNHGGNPGQGPGGNPGNGGNHGGNPGGHHSGPGGNPHGGNPQSWPGWHGSRGWHNPPGYYNRGGYYNGGWQTGRGTVVVWVNQWYPGWQVYRWRWDGYSNRWVVWIRNGSVYRTVYVGNNFGWHNYRGGYVW